MKTLILLLTLSVSAAAQSLASAESLFFAGSFERANVAFTALAKKPASEARATFKRVVDEFPNSNYVAEARQQMTLLG